MSDQTPTPRPIPLEVKLRFATVRELHGMLWNGDGTTVVIRELDRRKAEKSQRAKAKEAKRRQQMRQAADEWYRDHPDEGGRS